MMLLLVVLRVNTATKQKETEMKTFAEYQQEARDIELAEASRGSLLAMVIDFLCDCYIF